MLDLPLHPLRFTPELHPPQLGDQQLQLLDLCLARSELFIFRLKLHTLEKNLLVLGENEGSQCGGIERVQIRKSRAQCHRARSMPELFSRARKMRTEIKNQQRKLRKGKRSSFTPPSAARSCVPDDASRSLPTTSRAAPPSAKPFRSPLAAR